jgi:hypothetical protein
MNRGTKQQRFIGSVCSVRNTACGSHEDSPGSAVGQTSPPSVSGRNRTNQTEAVALTSTPCRANASCNGPIGTARGGTPTPAAKAAATPAA